MPASLPGATLAQNLANPSQGNFVTFPLLSGPKGSPFDRDQSGNASTGGLSTGIGFGASGMPSVIGPTAPQSIKDKGFNDDYVPGVTKPDGTASANSTIMHIGGGRMIINPDAAERTSIPFKPSPYTAGFGIGGAGNGGSRDAGAGPAFTGFTMKTVTATGAVANGAAIETGFINRSGVAMVAGQSLFGSSNAATATPALVNIEGQEVPEEEIPERTLGVERRADYLENKDQVQLPPRVDPANPENLLMRDETEPAREEEPMRAEETQTDPPPISEPQPDYGEPVQQADPEPQQEEESQPPATFRDPNA